MLRRRAVRWVRRAFARAAGPASPVRPPRERRAAFVGPFPPARTGIASYDAEILACLERIGFTGEIPIDPLWPVGPRERGLLAEYPLGIFQLGNNVEFHLDVYRALWAVGGLLVLHDLALDDFVRGMLRRGDPLGFVAVREALALRGAIRDPDVLQHGPLAVPWCAAVTHRVQGIVVHSAFGRRYLESIGCRTPVFVVPHPVPEDPAAFRRAVPRAAALRRRLEASGMRRLVVAPGDVNGAKQLGALARAMATLDRSVHAAVVGRRIDQYDVEPEIDRAGVAERMTAHHDVSDDEFRAWLVAADVVVDLRHPHRGEVSGSLLRAMQAGRATIVSGTGSYLDVPGDAVVRVGAGPADPTELAAAIRHLLESPDDRRRIAAAAAEHVERLRATAATATGYAEAIRATMDVVTHPTYAVEAAWARRLLEVGVTEDLAARGHGAAYVEALRGFTRSP